MRLLLDTQVAIWALTDPSRIADDTAALIADETNEIFVSAASLWDIAIKFPLGRPSAPPFSADVAMGSFREAGYRFLDITPRHAAAVETLPPLHADPFDRLLIAQAITEPLRLVSADAMVARYPIAAIRA